MNNLNKTMTVVAAVAMIAAVVAVIRWWPSPANSDSMTSDTSHSTATAKRSATERPNRVPHTRERGATIDIRGTVRDAHTEHGIDGVGVSFAPVDDVRAAPQATTKRGGRFHIRVPPGAYRVHVSGPVVLVGGGRALVTGARDDFDIRVSRMARVEGRVVDQRGHSLAGIDVTYQSDTARDNAQPVETASLRTDEQGAFSLLVPPGVIELIASSSASPASRTTLRWVEPAAVLTGVEIVMERAFQLAGTVVDPDNEPVANATVQARAPQRGARWRTATSDSAGRFEIRGLSTGPVEMVATASGFAASALTIASVGTGRDADESGHGDSRDIVLQLQAMHAISGRVIDDRGQITRADNVIAAPMLGEVGGGSAPVRADGTFRLQGLGIGPFALTARGPGVVATTVVGVRAPADNVELVVPRAGIIEGTVVDDSGAPITDFWLRLDHRERATTGSSDNAGIASSGQRPERRIATDDGQYRIDGIRPGRYQVTLWARGWAPRTIPGILVPPAAAVRVDAQFERGGSLSGVVTDAHSGRPIRGAIVQVSTGTESPVLYTDERGAFKIDDVAPGRRSLHAEHPGYISRLETGVEVGLGGLQTVNLALDRLAFGADPLVEFAGIGAVLAMEDGGLFVRATLPHAPAEVAGLLPGDEVTHLDGQPTRGRSMGENIEGIRGVVGTVVRLTVQRGDTQIVRDVVRASVRFRPGDTGAPAPDPSE